MVVSYYINGFRYLLSHLIIISVACLRILVCIELVFFFKEFRATKSDVFIFIVIQAITKGLSVHLLRYPLSECGCKYKVIENLKDIIDGCCMDTLASYDGYTVQ